LIVFVGINITVIWEWNYKSKEERRKGSKYEGEEGSTEKGNRG
jgi:hypothetical protein